MRKRLDAEKSVGGCYIVRASSFKRSDLRHDNRNRKKNIRTEVFVNEESACRRLNLKDSLGHPLRESSVTFGNLYHVSLSFGSITRVELVYVLTI